MCGVFEQEHSTNIFTFKNVHSFLDDMKKVAYLIKEYHLFKFLAQNQSFGVHLILYTLIYSLTY